MRSAYFDEIPNYHLLYKFWIIFNASDVLQIPSEHKKDFPIGFETNI